MKIRSIYIIIALIVFGFPISLLSQVNYYVTDPYLDHSQYSLDVIIDKAIISANTNQNVIVYFNAPSLCEVSFALPQIKIDRGSITFKKGPNTISHQGIKMRQGISLTSGFVTNNSGSSSITFDGLDIIDFSVSNCDAIRIAELSKNITIKNCNLNNNDVAIRYNNGCINILIENNKFNNNGTSIILDGTKPLASLLSKLRSSMIKNNVIYSNTTGSSVVCSRIVSPSFPYFRHSFTFENNTIIGNSSKCISLINNNNNSLLTDSSFEVTINNNNISGATGIYLEAPLPVFNISNNVIHFSKFGVEILGSNRLTSDVRIDFINPNTLGFTPKNNNNSFYFEENSIFSNIYSISVSNDLYVRIIGYDLPSRVLVNKGYPSIIRQNKIVSAPGNMDYPIVLQYGNQNIASPSDIWFLQNGTELSVNYKLVGTEITQANADFAVDVYKSNANGDLLEHIGTQVVSTLASNYTAQFNFSSSIPIEKLALTVTGYGNYSSSTPVGTSQASYASATNCHCDDLDFCFASSGGCIGVEVVINTPTINCPPDVSTTYTINYGDGTANTTSLSHTYSTAGTYMVMLILRGSDRCLADTVKKSFSVSDCNHNCIDCIGSYSPEPGKHYVLSAWVMEENASPRKTSYTFPIIKLTFVEGENPPTFETFTPKGQIIDGWQQIEKDFWIPSTATGMTIELLSESEENCFFDDIRVFPFDGTMKSYVYDPITLRLVAELDENNYATFYEYDEEGKLVRVKKETVKGVMTIKENKNSSVKRQ